MDTSDEQLVSRVAAGESAALHELMERYRRRVYGVLVRGVGRSADADDLYQETWIRVARRAATFDPSRAFAPWVATIATNLVIDWLRSNARTTLADSDATFEERASDARDPEQALAAAAAQRSVARALAALPEPMRRAILMRYFDELSEEEMAAQLGVPKGTVKSRLHNALRSLRKGVDDVA